MTKNELKRYRSIVKEIEQIKEQIARTENQVLSAPIKAITDMPISQSEDFDKIGRVVARVDELNDILYEKLDELVKLQIDIEKAIANLEITERTLMRHRYIKGMKWEEICTEMNYSWNVVHTIHRKALTKLGGEDV